jgi:pimeloyl-ACP methyl ester carboxylesterase
MRTDLSIPSGATAALDTSRRRSLSSDRDRPTVLLIPGYTGSKEDFMPLLRPLSTAGFRAVAIDQRGQYESSWAESIESYRVDALARDVCDLAREVRADGRELHLVGHSFGGLVSRAAVLDEPELFDTLTLLSSGPGAIDGARRQMIMRNEPILEREGLEAVWERMDVTARTDPKYKDAPPAMLAFLRRRFLSNDPDGLKVMGNELLTIGDRTDELAKAAQRLLVIHGVTDDAWPPDVQRDMAERLGADYVVIPEAAHSPAVENPAATVAALLDFLLP